MTLPAVVNFLYYISQRVSSYYGSQDKCSDPFAQSKPAKPCPTWPRPAQHTLASATAHPRSSQGGTVTVFSPG
ncbi:hypothetical protein AGOR_G00095090 [Albula goreensis]|uniref:Uncharacterized protein n=1 Tax=Albula goreensis TaxID=1534307 RepID=A0A8T3DMA6_9TELE|nr:hypothetical protein AGOR_G00095090 [Albula goreensis]